MLKCDGLFGMKVRCAESPLGFHLVTTGFADGLGRNEGFGTNLIGMGWN